MTSHQTQERRASLLPSAATAEGATRSPQDAPSASIRKTVRFHRFTIIWLFLPLAIISGVAFWSLVTWLAVVAAALWIERIAG